MAVWGTVAAQQRRSNRPRSSRTLPPGRRPRVLVTYKKSVFQIYVQERKNERMRSLLQAGDRSVQRMRESHEAHVRTVQDAKKILTDLGAKLTLRYRGDTNHTEHADLVVTLGGDGTLLWASHFVSPDIPVIAINTAPKDSVGYFCAGGGNELADLLADAVDGTLRGVRLSRMRVELDDQVISNRILNDVLFAHGCPAATSRYLIEHGEHCEDHKSSGVWVGPAAGSTAARRSAGGKAMKIQSRRLEYVVREPYFFDAKHYRLKQGYVSPGDSLAIQSKMRQGRLYLDGSRLQSPVEYGSHIRMTLSDEPLWLLGFRGCHESADNG